ncbi:Pre-mRNA-splicing factor SPF27 [Dichotomopilus funicola]|uniref:Pre-mRNA-splicing factor SPF27 n=1 Tax=Dichotomopilus funicola TaxID=1934379 RepID=A0AAN6ZN83_9PEZI|nr:Pre-mRNA-splicing factor SPF27 [Dichotomopilus funicola]
MPVDFVHQSLPYIDPEPTPEAIAAAEALITEERALVPDDPHHIHLPPAPTPTPFLTPLLTAELARLSSSTDPSTAKLSALNFTRYEAPEPPAANSPNTTTTSLQTALSQAYTSHAYIASRRAHLALLDTHGRNAWLIGNEQLAGELRQLETELAAAKREVDLVTLNRRAAQDAVAGEMGSLAGAWQRGVGRVLETEAAVEGVRREVVEGLRRG